MQETYKCSKAVMRKCKEYKCGQCDGTYVGIDCQCAKDNQKQMPNTERNELIRYRATNHTPEECAAAFEELAAYRAAEQDGTLLRLPCKVGDTVWILCNVFGGNEQKRVIESRTITEIKHNKFNKNTMISKEPFELHFFPSEIGKTVFLTREAAEAALKEQEANQ